MDNALDPLEDSNDSAQSIKRGQQVLDSDYSEFSAIDPFNPQNHVEGQISFNRTRYGSLTIKKINGEPVDQPQIFGTRLKLLTLSD